MSKQRSEQARESLGRAQVAGYRGRALARAPRSMLRIRTALSVGPRGARLGLDSVPGVVWVTVSDHGSEGVHMPPGHALVEVWGGEPSSVFAAVLSSKPPGVTVVARWRPAGPWHRFKRWARFTAWRIADRFRGSP